MSLFIYLRVGQNHIGRNVHVHRNTLLIANSTSPLLKLNIPLWISITSKQWLTLHNNHNLVATNDRNDTETTKNHELHSRSVEHV